jgi:peptide subunit release factor 1 (eRF1)
MARSITWDDLRALAEVELRKGRGISFYLNLDPSVAPLPADAQTRFHSLLDGAAKLESATEPGLSHDERIALRADLDRVRRYFEQDFVRDGTQGLAIFCAGLDEVWSTLPLVAPVDDEVSIGRLFLLAPLASLVGRGTGALVVVASRELGLFYELRDGRLAEVADLTEEQLRRHDQGGLAQARLQRHVDQHISEHLRAVAERLDRLVRRARGGVEVVIAAPDDSRAELSTYLTKEVQDAFAGWIHAEAHATPAELEALIAPVLAERRSARERALLETWAAGLGTGGRAASGWAAILEAVSDARVETLLVRAGTDHPAWRCPLCGRAVAEPGECALDGTPVEPFEPGIDLAVHHALRHGGTVWVVEDADDLDESEGVGALLRF